MPTPNHSAPEKYRCRLCGCLWKLNPPQRSGSLYGVPSNSPLKQGSWSLYAFNQKAGACCNNHPGFLLVIDPVWA